MAGLEPRRLPRRAARGHRRAPAWPRAFPISAPTTCPGAAARRPPAFLARQLPDGNPVLLRLLGRAGPLGHAQADCRMGDAAQPAGSRPERAAGYFKIAPQYSLKGIEHLIQCPTFVSSAEDDDLSIDASKLYDALTCPKRYYRFSSAEGAGQHCESGAHPVPPARLRLAQRRYSTLPLRQDPQVPSCGQPAS